MPVSYRTPAVITTVATLLVVAACAQPTTRGAATVAPPMVLDRPAYDMAADRALVPTDALEFPGLHRVFRLSEQIISGAEPHGDRGLAQIAALGVKTILSVDGKLPDTEGARRHDLRYVHIPIQYRGITAEERLQIAKTFRELPGPFYVHCFHGQHRGPAAAAIGRVLLDDAPRELAIAEMRQWCGTSPKYEGLYATIAAGDLPTPDATATYDWDFPAQHPLDGLRQLMIGVARSYDRLAELADNGWSANPDHPDVDPTNEAAILTDLFKRAHDLPEMSLRPAGFAELVVRSELQSGTLRDVLAAARSGQADWDQARDALAGLRATCTACHSAWRND